MIFNEKKGLILEEEDKEIFEECNKDLTNKSTPIADSIMKSILKPLNN